MKKFLFSVFSFTLVLGFLLLPAGSVKAALGDDPVVTPVSGDMEFTTEVVSIAHLPGTTELDQMLVPVGFPLGEAQFEGNGVLVSGFDSGKATACFTISGLQFGWGGKVGVWNGAKWVLLPTTITTSGSETLSTTACAPITGNGNYAFIKWVTDPSKLPGLPECTVTMTPQFWSFDNGETVFFSVYFGSSVPTNTPVYYQVLSYSPLGSVSGDMSGTTLASTWADFNTLLVDLEVFDTATLYVELPFCKKTLEYNEGTTYYGGGGG